MNKLFLYLSFISFSNLKAVGIISTTLNYFPVDTLKIKKDTVKKVQLEEISIHAVRADRRFPVTETSLNTKDIDMNYTGQEMQVILAKSPSITWYSDGGNYTGYSYLRLRGIDQTRVNFTLNGVPLNEPEDQGAYFSNYPDFLNSVRSIQVQRGVGLSTYGSSSFAGSVNMESPSLTDSGYVELNSSFGSYNTYRVSPEFNTGLLKNKWGLYGRYSNVGSDGFKDHSGTKGQSFLFSGGYFWKKGIIKFTNFMGYSKNEMAYLAAPDTTLKKDYRTNLLTKDEKDKFKQSLTMLNYTAPIGKNSFLNSTVYYNYLEGGYSILFAPDLYNFSVKSDFFGGIINYQYRKNKLTLNSGIHANNYVRYHSSYVEPNKNVLLYKNFGQKKEFATFLKLSYDIKKITLFADVQYRTVQFTYQADKNTPLNILPVNWQFINPKGGVSYSLKDKHLVYASIGKTSREPTRNDMFAGYDNIDSLNYLEIGKLNRVKPESVTDIEAGIKLLFQRFKLDLNIYSMEFKNEIAAIGQLSYIGLPLRKNVESSFRRGIELNFMVMPTKKLSLTTQANLSSNRIKTYTTDYDSVTYLNVQPLLTPQIIINQGITYSINKKIKFDVNGRYMSKSYLDNSNNKNYMTPASLIINSSLCINFYKEHSINFMVNNITDTKYYTSGYVQNMQPYYFAMATRNYFVTLKLRF
jgi:iron complex outermembrane receptor protein